jgi:hypothetical protein
MWAESVAKAAGFPMPSTKLYNPDFYFPDAGLVCMREIATYLLADGAFPTNFQYTSGCYSDNP